MDRLVNRRNDRQIDDGQFDRLVNRPNDRQIDDGQLDKWTD